MKLTFVICRGGIAACVLFTISNYALAEGWHFWKSKPIASPPRKYLGDVYVSFIGIRPLSAVIDDLQPQFEMTPQGALQIAVPNTLSSSESALSSINTALQVSLMFSGNGGNPTNPSASAGQNAIGALTNLYGSPLGMDAISQYEAAASLFQQIKLLNRSLKDVPHYKGFAPYIVTAQITLIPYQKNLPYDAYANVVFFTDTNDPPAPPTAGSESVPLVFPTLTSDELESANDQQSMDHLRELDLALAAAVHGVGVAGSYDRLNQKFQALNGNDLNSLVTVGKISQNCVAVRLGARNQPGSEEKQDIVPERHDVSFLILAPTNSEELQMICYTTFRDSSTGMELPPHISELEGPENLADIFRMYLNIKQNQFDKLISPADSASYKAVSDLKTELVNDVFDDYHTTSTLLKTALLDYLSNSANFSPEFLNETGKNGDAINRVLHLDDVDDNSLWLDVTRLGIDDYSADLISLPDWRPNLPDTNQTVLYTEDGQSTLFTLNAGQRLAASKMYAELTLAKAGETHVLFSDQIDVTGDESDLSVRFPALSRITRATPEPAGDATEFLPINLVLHCGHPDDSDCYYPTSNTYTNFIFLTNLPADHPPLPWKIIRTYGYLTAGTATNEFSIVLATNSPEAGGNWFLDVQGPLNFTFLPTTGILGARTNGVYPLKPSPPCEITFNFGSLPAGMAVDFNLLNGDQAFIRTLNHQIVYPVNSSAASTASASPAASGSH